MCGQRACLLSNDPSLNPSEVNSLFCKISFKNNYKQ